MTSIEALEARKGTVYGCHIQPPQYVRQTGDQRFSSLRKLQLAGEPAAGLLADDTGTDIRSTEANAGVQGGGP